MASPLFQVQPSSGVPIWRQLHGQTTALIAAGRLRPGDLLPSVRALAEELAIHPMTVSKAWAQLERDGLVAHEAGIGMRIAAGPAGDPLAALDPLLADTAQRARQYGLGEAAVIARLRQHLRGDPPASAGDRHG